MKKFINLIIWLGMPGVLYGCMFNNSEPEIRNGIPSEHACYYREGTDSATQVDDRLYFISGKENNLYYALPRQRGWKVAKTSFNDIREIQANKSIIYLLGGAEWLVAYDTEKEETLFQIDLDEEIKGERDRLFDMVTANDNGIYLQGSYEMQFKEGIVKEDDTIFANIDEKGEISILKQISSSEGANLTLVEEELLFYNWRDSEGNYKVLSWNMETDNQKSYS